MGTRKSPIFFLISYSLGIGAKSFPTRVQKFVEPIVVGIHRHMVSHRHPLVPEHAPFRQEGGVLPGILMEGDHMEALPCICDGFVGVGRHTLGFQEGRCTRVCESVACGLEGWHVHRPSGLC